MHANQLVMKIKKGDSEAFSELYREFFQKISRFVKQKIQNAQEAEDILQDVFLEAYKGIPNLPLKNLNFSAWLYKVASNTINDYFRKKYRTPELTPIDEGFDIPDKVSVSREVEIKSDVELAQNALQSLPSRYREVLELKLYNDYSSKEISQMLKKSNISVRLLQCRGLKKVRQILSQSVVKKLNYQIA